MHICASYLSLISTECKEPYCREYECLCTSRFIRILSPSNTTLWITWAKSNASFMWYIINLILFPWCTHVFGQHTGCVKYTIHSWIDWFILNLWIRQHPGDRSRVFAFGFKAVQEDCSNFSFISYWHQVATASLTEMERTQTWHSSSKFAPPQANSSTEERTLPNTTSLQNCHHSLIRLKTKKNLLKAIHENWKVCK